MSKTRIAQPSGESTTLQKPQPNSVDSPLAPAAVSVTATLADDIGLGAKKNPGDTITYTAVLSTGGASPADDATGVVFTDILNSNTTLVGGSLNAQPIARADAYTASGNIPISLAAPGVLTNDIDPMTGTNAGLTVTEVQGAGANVGAATNTSAVGRGAVNGSITLNTNGSFTYEPPPGFTGSDTFTYKTSEGTLTDTNTVTITISNMVWFIKNTGVSSNRGTFSNPFTTIATFNSANAAGGATDPKNGDIVSLRTGTYSEGDGLNLRNTQKLIGEAVQFNTVFTADSNSSSAYTTFAAATNTAPTVNATAGNGIDLADSNTVRGLNVGTTPGFFGFNGGAVGSPVINTVAKTGTGGAINVSTSGTFGANVTFATLESTSSPTANINLVAVTGTLGITSGGTGLTGSAASSNAITINGGTVGFTYPGNVTKASLGALLSVSGGHTGTVTFQTGTLTASAGSGFQFDNADGTYNFNGANSVTSGASAGVNIQNGSGGTFTFSSSSSITNPSAIAYREDTSTPTVTYNGTIGKNTAANAVSINAKTGGTTNFNGGITATTTTANAINLTSNTGGTINFNGNTTTGGLSLTTTTGVGFNATGGGTISAIQNNTTIVNTISSTTGTALNVSNTNIGGSGLTFRSISANGGTNGIVVNNAGSGGFTVSGDGSTGSAKCGGGTGAAGLLDCDGSGGTIQSTTQDAIVLTNISNATLRQMNITNAGWDGVQSTGGSNIVLSAMNINHPGNANPAPDGSTGNTSGFGGGNGWFAENMSGTNAFNNNSRIINWQSSQSNGVVLHNTSVNFTSFTVDNVLISTSATAAAGFHANLNGATDGQVGVTNSEFTLIDQNAAQILNNGSGTIRAIVQGNNFHDADATSGDGNNTLYLANSHEGHLNFTIGGAGALGNTFHNLARLTTLAGVVQVDAAGGDASTPAGGTINGTITNNNIWNDSGFVNGRRAIDIQVEADSHNLGQLVAAITNNTVNNVQGNAIHVSVVSVGGGSVTDANWTITGNSLGAAGTNNGIRVGLDNTDSSSAIEFETNVDLIASSNAQLVNKLLVSNNTGRNSANNATGGTLDITNIGSSGASGNATLNATITNNTLTNVDTAGTGHVLDVLNSSASSHETLNLNITGNNTTLGASAAGEIRLRQLAGTFNVQGGVASVSANNSGDTVNTTGSFGTVGSVTTPINPSFLEAASSGVEVAGGTTTTGETSQLTQNELDGIVAAAIARWSSTGLAANQITVIRSVKFEIADLPGAYLGEANGNRIMVDSDAEGRGWFVDSDPLSDNNFGCAFSATRLYADPSKAPAGHIDLLTAIEHEIGHKLGLDDSYSDKDRDSIMYGYLTVGERRSPARGQAIGVRPGRLIGSHFLSLSTGKQASNSLKRSVGDKGLVPLSGETVTVNGAGSGFTIPGGHSVTITFQATVNNPPGTRAVTTQGKVSGSNFALVNGITTASPNTNDPETGAANDATVTNIDTTITWTGATNTDWNTATNWNVPGPVVSSYAPGISNFFVNDVIIPNVGAQPTISLTDISIYSLNLANGRTLTITSPPTLEIAGSPGGNLTLDGIINGGNLKLGLGTHVINNAGGTGSLTSATLLSVLFGGIVTLNNNLQMGALAINSSGSMDLSPSGGRTLSLNGPGAALTVSGGGTLTTTGSTVVFNGTAAQQAAGIVYNNLTINNTLGLNVTGVTLTGNTTVNGALALTSSDLNTGAFTLTQPNTTASTGVSDVVGTVTRSSGAQFALATPLTFGNPNNIFTFTAGAARPTSVTMTMAKAAPASYAAAVQRNYLITTNLNGSAFTSTLRLHYLDGELNSNTEASLNLRYLRASDSHWVAALPTTRDGGNNWVESTAVANTFLPTQFTFSSLAPTASDAVITGRILDNDGAPVEGAVVRLEGAQNRKFITDAHGVYRFENVETNGFYTVTPSRVNYTFSPAARSFSQAGESTEATFGATALTNNFVNPLDTPEYFVRQHYLDFLGREPDEAGFNFWSDEIIGCGADQDCIGRKRENVSAAYFLSIEFQETGRLVDGLNRAGFGVRPNFSQFMTDTRAIGLGVVVGRDGWQSKLQTNKEAFVADFVNRPAFHAQYDGMESSAFVDNLISHAGVSFTSSERDALVTGLTQGTTSRAQALTAIAENQRFVNAKFNNTFVMMEYFGYLRRDPDAAGFQYWLDKLNQFGGNFEQAEMVKAFIVSGEYRDRFPK